MYWKFVWDGNIGTWEVLDSERFKTVDTEKYDIVEKKEAKIERLELEIKAKKETSEYFRELAERYIRNQLELGKEIEKIQEELDELKELQK